MQTPKARNGSSDVPKKLSPRAARQLKITGLKPDSSSSSSPASRTPKEKSPKPLDRCSPRSPACEKKRPSRISELEAQLSQLQDELKNAREQLSLSETGKKQAEQDAEDSKKQLVKLSSELEESQKKLQEHSASEESSCKYASALASVISEIHELRCQIEIMAASEAEQAERSKTTASELENLEGRIIETFSFVEKMKNQFRDCEVSESENEALTCGTLAQLEAAKAIVEDLRLKGSKSMDAYKRIAEELEKSKARVSSVEGSLSGLASGVETGLVHYVENHTQPNMREEKLDSNVPEGEISSLRSEVEWLRCALNATENKLREEQNDREELLRRSYDSQLKEAKSKIEELKANLMDKETEVQCISDENESLCAKLQSSAPSKREVELENDLKKLEKAVEDLKASVMAKDTELWSITEENETLRQKIRELEGLQRGARDDVAAQVEKLRLAEREAVTKLGLAMEEAEKSNLKVARVSEQLEAAQAANSEMEAEFRRLKVQSDQWRKAAEAAAAMLSVGNNGKFLDRNEDTYSPSGRKAISPYSDEANDDDLLKKKNGNNVLKKIGVLWKKPPK